MSLYTQFKTDSKLETSGIVLDYGDFKVTVARAGGANKKFARLLNAKTKAYKRAIQTDTMDVEVGDKIVREVYAEAVVLNWETKVEGKFKQGIEAQDGKLLPFNRENLIKTFENVPDIFTDIQQQASTFALFRETVLEEESKN